MISVIIPTLLRVNRLSKTIQELSDCEEVGEIIIINNTQNQVSFDNPKVREIFEGKNTYINPAWNKGASLATFNKLCIMNDDIWFDWEYLKDISKFITEDRGMIGMSSNNYDTPIDKFQINPIFGNQKTTRGHRPTGYACCFFIHKNNWDLIPEELKLWAGDDWIFYRSKNYNYVIDGIKCHGYLSATLDDESLEKEFNPIKENDMMSMKEFVKKGLIENYLLGTKWW
jgi:glycosyltransferase involved in cell wall biosynthesis